MLFSGKLGQQASLSRLPVTSCRLYAKHRNMHTCVHVHVHLNKCETQVHKIWPTKAQRRPLIAEFIEEISALVNVISFSVFGLRCEKFNGSKLIILFSGGLALPSKAPHTPDSSPDVSRFQPSPNYTIEVKYLLH